MGYRRMKVGVKTICRQQDPEGKRKEITLYIYIYI